MEQPDDEYVPGVGGQAGPEDSQVQASKDIEQTGVVMSQVETGAVEGDSAGLGAEPVGAEPAEEKSVETVPVVVPEAEIETAQPESMPVENPAVEPVPVEPVPVEPVPVEPVPAEPVPAEPVLVEPAEVQPVELTESTSGEPVIASAPTPASTTTSALAPVPSAVPSPSPSPAPAPAPEEDDDDDAYEPTHEEPKPKTKRKRLPQDIVGQLEDHLSDNKRDLVAWRALISLLKEKGKLAELRDTYEKMLVVFPTSSETWIDYIDTELSNGEFVRVEQLFSRCLNEVLTVDLWSYYLSYVRRINNVNTEGDKARNVISQVYGFVLDKVGIDRESGPIWAQYLEFIASNEPTTTWEQQQKMDLLRKTYRQAIGIPLKNLETLWQAYNAFENGLNKTTARKFVGEKSGTYMNARSCLRELTNMTTDLVYNTTPSERRWTREEQYQEDLWLKVLEWEKKNRLELDETALTTRVKYFYRQAVMNMSYHPRVWFEAAHYLLDKGDTTEAIELLETGQAANPTSFMITLKLVEIQEKDHQASNVRKTFDRLLQNLASARQLTERKLQEWDEEEEDNQGKSKDQLTNDLELNARDSTMAYIHYMRTMKRMEGIKEARKIFGEGRKLEYIGHELYSASAMMEFYNNKEAGIANKIFEIGVKRYPKTPGFVQRYFDFLILTNDDTNARALFEKAVAQMTAEDARPLYENFLRYEANYGELTALSRIEDRYLTFFPDESRASLFERRYQVDDYNPVREVDLGQRYQGQAEFENKESNRQSRDNRTSRHSTPVPSVSLPAAPRKTLEPSAKRAKDDRAQNSGVIVEQGVQNALPAGVLNLLKILPPASSYDTVTFDAAKLIRMIRDTQIPDHLWDA